MACTVVRTMLLSGCWAVSVLPAVCVWKRNIWLFASVVLKRSFMIRAQRRRAARNLATSSKNWLWALKKKLSRGAKASSFRPASKAACT